ncbi:MAG TPA: TolC family protein [Cytophaga sp.]|jgi:cobalt-zinc-cadmium efflux system outer membrane protein|nr:TolC family protein [Cytophaga sp.]
MKYIAFFLLFVNCILAQAQKSTTLAEAEAQMQKNNLLLIAEQYNISASQAAVIQAKIWEQPYLLVEANMINPQYNKTFDVGSDGQKAASIQQLIYMGGKKRNEVDFAKTNVVIAQLQFEQLIRNLKFQLAETFYTIYYDKQKVTTIEKQISKLDTLLTNYEIQAEKGNVPLKDVVRLQSLVLTLKKERNELDVNIIEEQQTIALITGILEPIDPLVNEKELILKYESQTLTKDSLVSVALLNNLEYLTAIKISESQEIYLKWQKSLSVPDLTAGVAYDQRGGAFQNQVDFTLGIPLPLWNKNRGNIQLATAQAKQANVHKEYQRMELESRVDMLWRLWVQQKNQLETINSSVNDNMNVVYLGMVHNFERRNASLLEFTDFMESFNQTFIYMSEIKKSLIMASLRLNYITNKEIF